MWGCIPKIVLVTISNNKHSGNLNFLHWLLSCVLVSICLLPCFLPFAATKPPKSNTSSLHLLENESVMTINIGLPRQDSTCLMSYQKAGCEIYIVLHVYI